MYKIFLDDALIFDDQRTNEGIVSASLDLEVNKAGSMSISLYPTNPYYDSFTKMKSIVKVVRNDSDIIFVGRVYSSEEDIFKCRKISVEGELAYLNDSFMPPFGYSDSEGSTKYTPVALFTDLVSKHNDCVGTDHRRFEVGSITVENSSVEIEYNLDTYQSCIDFLSDLINRCGGYVYTRHENNEVYLDWVSEVDSATQTVEFGKNLLDMNRSTTGEEIVTAILPFGEVNEDTGYPTDISEMDIPETDKYKKVGKYIYNKQLFDEYGLIVESRQYDGYPLDFINEVLNDVENLTGIIERIEVSALDLSTISNVESFGIRSRIHVVSPSHNVDTNMILTKMTVDFLDVSNSTLSFGSESSLISILETNRKTNEKLMSQTQADLDFLKGTVDDVKELEQNVSVSYNINTKVARIFQSDRLNWAYMDSDLGKIRINCTSTTDYPNEINTTGLEPSDKTGYFAVKEVTEDSQTFYRPCFIKKVVNTTVKWYTLASTPVEVSGNVLVIGMFDFVSGSTSLFGVAKTLDRAEKDSFMEYLSKVEDITDANLQTYASASGIDNIFKKIAILEAFVHKLNANNIDAGNGDFSFKLQTYNSNGNLDPFFEIKKGAEILFKVDMTTGKIYFGESFNYDPSTKIISSKNGKVKINADGTLEAINGSFGGTINATNGSFSNATMTEITSDNFEFGNENRYWGSNINWSKGFGSGVSTLLTLLKFHEGLPKNTPYRGTVNANGTSIGTEGTYSYFDDYSGVTFTDNSGNSIAFGINTYSNANGVSINGGSVVSLTSGTVSVTYRKDLVVPIAKALIPWDMKYSYSDPTYLGTVGNPFDYGHFKNMTVENLIIKPIVMNYGSNYNLGSEGSTQLPNGMILKWKKFDTVGGDSVSPRTWTFGDPFPNECVYMFANQIKTDQNRDAYFYGYIMYINKNNVTFSAYNGFPYYCMALGY